MQNQSIKNTSLKYRFHLFGWWW